MESNDVSGQVEQEYLALDAAKIITNAIRTLAATENRKVLEQFSGIIYTLSNARETLESMRGMSAKADRGGRK